MHQLFSKLDNLNTNYELSKIAAKRLNIEVNTHTLVKAALQSSQVSLLFLSNRSKLLALLGIKGQPHGIQDSTCIPLLPPLTCVQQL